MTQFEQHTNAFCIVNMEDKIKVSYLSKVDRNIFCAFICPSALLGTACLLLKKTIKQKASCSKGVLQKKSVRMDALPLKAVQIIDYGKLCDLKEVRFLMNDEKKESPQVEQLFSDLCLTNNVLSWYCNPDIFLYLTDFLDFYQKVLSKEKTL